MKREKKTEENRLGTLMGRNRLTPTGGVLGGEENVGRNNYANKNSQNATQNSEEIIRKTEYGYKVGAQSPMGHESLRN